jgi:hypothetical protein
MTICISLSGLSVPHIEPPPSLTHTTLYILSPSSSSSFTDETNKSQSVWVELMPSTGCWHSRGRRRRRRVVWSEGGISQRGKELRIGPEKEKNKED